jgi:hypothetical protein
MDTISVTTSHFTYEVLSPFLAPLVFAVIMQIPRALEKISKENLPRQPPNLATL